ncbi:hypothetical protein J31TS4_45230 [Paenibacillus sp. J31TS4]|uniref:DinB family protein n=1 Tax=Paenibacillus sp. J31TS4 TaxID=2807195 RepID=UPI001B02E85F|nr:DinB family protein [Paenibacillus sp. J31TS4]GIP41243.1 hypothetical protein J31TS4_45230 [Paenibacillus sp. J31TS4]
MFVTVNQFVKSWSHEAAATQRVLDMLTDDSLRQEIAPQSRTLGQLAWHLVVTIPEMLGRTGLAIPFPEGGEKAPASASVIAEAYKRTGQAMLEIVQSQWTDDSLQQSNDMYGEQWPNGLTLHALIQHEIHHRGQMTVLMRQAGLRVPGIYGPTREDWIDQGLTPLL